MVNIATLSGVLFLIPCFHRKTNDDNKPKSTIHLDIIIPAFAAGALIATVVFLTVPESIGQMQTSVMEAMEAMHAEEEVGEVHEEEEHEEHGFEILPSVSWRFGASLLGGFLLPMFLAAVFPHVHSDHHLDENQEERCEESGTDEEAQNDLEKPKKNDEPGMCIAFHITSFLIKSCFKSHPY